MKKPVGKSMPEVMQILADEAMKRKETVAVVDNTYTNHRLVGWIYCPQGYRDTQDRPKLSLLVIEGDRLRDV